MANHLIVFNGPPRSGKDTATDITKKFLQRYMIQATKFSVAEPIKDTVHKFYGLDKIYSKRALELLKDKPLEELDFGTLRNEYINFAEVFVKPRHGIDFFGKLAVRRMQKFTIDKYFIISDCGFDAELKPIVDYIGIDNTKIFKLIRKGRDFSKDSRGYIQDYPTIPIFNNGTMKEFTHSIETMVNLHFVRGVLGLGNP
jgi:hypothetical protein